MDDLNQGFFFSFPHPLNFFFGKQIRKSYWKGSKNTTMMSSKPKGHNPTSKGTKGPKRALTELSSFFLTFLM